MSKHNKNNSDQATCETDSREELRMRRNVIIGSILVIIQWFVYRSSSFPQFSFKNFSVFLYDLFHFLGYSFIGIIGVVFLVIGFVQLSHFKIILDSTQANNSNEGE